MATANSKSKTATATAAEGVLVHAYRRVPHMVSDGAGRKVERDVEVVCCGEKIKFRSNEEGHVVGLVRTPEALHRLVKEIPEAYIVYKGGANVPEKTVEAGPVRPVGAFVLESAGQDGPIYVVLDTMEDAALREFAIDAGIEAEELPEALTGEDLRRAIYNLLGGAQ